MAHNAIPVYADKLLFAEDFVTYTFRHNTGMRLAPVFRHYREFVHTGFNDAVKAAAEVIETFVERDVDKDFTRLRDANGVDGEGYMLFAREIQEICFPEGFDPYYFLYYCVHMGTLAERFYDEGVLEVPMLAVLAIVEAIWNYDMFNGGWSVLNRIAKRFAALAADVEDLCTPPCTPPESSDEENDLPNADFQSENEEINSGSEDESSKDFFKLNLEENRMDEGLGYSSGFQSQENEEFSNSEREILIDNSVF